MIRRARHYSPLHACIVNPLSNSNNTHRHRQFARSPHREWNLIRRLFSANSCVVAVWRGRSACLPVSLGRTRIEIELANLIMFYLRIGAGVACAFRCACLSEAHRTAQLCVRTESIARLTPTQTRRAKAGAEWWNYCTVSGWRRLIERSLHARPRQGNAWGVNAFAHTAWRRSGEMLEIFMRVGGRRCRRRFLSMRYHLRCSPVHHLKWVFVSAQQRNRTRRPHAIT